MYTYVMQLHSLCNFVYIINSYILVSIDFIHIYIYTYIHIYIYICNRCIPKKKCFGFCLPPNPKPCSAEGIIDVGLAFSDGGLTLSFQSGHMIGRLNDSPALEGCWIFFLKKMESRFISNSSYPRSGVIFLCFPKSQVFPWVFLPTHD